VSALHEIGGGTKALPFDLALSVIPSLPRPLLARYVARAIERLDMEDVDPDLEADDHAEDDAPACGNVEDEGELDDERLV
jgi:hypothetical protein